MREYLKHTKLLNEIKHLSWKIKGVHSLHSHQVFQSQNNALMNLLSAEAKGTLQLTEYEHYKGFMFITIRNEIYKQLYVKKNVIKPIIDSNIKKDESLTFDDYISNYNKNEMYINEKEYKEQLYKFLTPKEKAMIRWRARGWTFKEIAIAFNLKENTTMNRYYSLLKKINKKGP